MYALDMFFSNTIVKCLDFFCNYLQVCAAEAIAQNDYVEIEFKKIDGALFLRTRIKDVEGFKRVVGEACLPPTGLPSKRTLKVAKKVKCN